MRLVLVCNPSSGSALPVEELHMMFDHAGIKIIDTIVMNDQLAKNLSPYLGKPTIIAVVGGDGTMSAVASKLAGTAAILAPLPGGTLNHFSKDLNVPQSVKAAIQRLPALSATQIDVARVNKELFINNSSVGVYPQSLRTREKAERNIGKWPAAVWAIVRALVRFKTYHVTIDGRATVTPFIFVGNNRYLFDEGGVSARDRLDEGVLTLSVAHTQSRLGLVRSGFLTVVGQVNKAQMLEVTYPSRVTIAVRRPKLSVARDGEVSRMSSPLHYEIAQKELNVLV